ncbi:hypothetical protein TVAG_064540 [Trichomonas vaginalis G3]|uniref:Cilia- and flagella-associated protein 36 n=1 Tax=Trichomonas vaginalis (strain ATCC PRA-98 / G3) TaxID=412133 RepID=A2EHC9_TRIV3|nr:phosphodiesterase HL family [Trichomonas vaginalis G3]EAY07907.1 hypothetical protein TVAG_064540 [Trichomonas vaginalis G3]KAI5531219.1 phosphodiesterase HL family [Trichomonas vaginalis G3]|eukprot:XP_001320130.1 hypothetical protein [Trichomonas vaginalis G3]
MNERTIIQICNFFTSEAWWKPVCGFLATNCMQFESPENTVEQYNLFNQFQSLVQDLFDSFLCKTVNMRPSALEQLMLQGYDGNIYQLRVLIFRIQELLNFEKFKLEMQATQRRIDEEVTNTMMMLREQSADDDAQNNAVDMLEKSEQISLQKQTEFCCNRTKDELRLNELHDNLQKSMGGPKTNPLASTSPVNSTFNTLGSLGPLSSPTGSMVNKGPPVTTFNPQYDAVRKSNPGKPLIMRPGLTKVKSSKLASLH